MSVNFSLEGKVALVTGASYGIGFAIASAYAKAGALGKLEAESRDLKLAGVLLDWTDELKAMCIESTEFAIAVRRKGKELAGYIALTADSGYEHRTVVDRRIVEKTASVRDIIGSHEFSIGIPDKKTRRGLAEKYYLGKETA